MLIVKNKKAFFSYNILEKYICGIQLKGSEVKSIRLGDVNVSEAYCYIKNGEIYIKNMNITKYKEGGTHNNHEPLRERKLLLHKKEIIKLQEKSSQKGLTIIPLCIILSKTGFIKVEIGLGKGKNLFDKKETIKLRDLDRDLKQSQS